MFVAVEAATRKQGDLRAIVWSKKSTDRMLVPASQASNIKDVTKFVRMQHPELMDIKLKKVSDHNLARDELTDFERTEIISRYKFGFLYVRDGQTMVAAAATG